MYSSKRLGRSALSRNEKCSLFSMVFSRSMPSFDRLFEELLDIKIVLCYTWFIDGCKAVDELFTASLKNPIHKPLLVGSFGVHMVANEGVLVLCFMQRALMPPLDRFLTQFLVFWELCGVYVWDFFFGVCLAPYVVAQSVCSCAVFLYSLVANLIAPRTASKQRPKKSIFQKLRWNCIGFEYKKQSGHEICWHFLPIWYGLVWCTDARTAFVGLFY